MSTLVLAIHELCVFCYTQSMKIYSWNVNGIRAVQKKGLLEPFMVEHQPDILCIQETKAQPDQVEADFASLLPDYHQYWYSAEKKGYSSTAIFSKEEPLQIINGIPEHIADKYDLVDSYGDTNNEGRVMVAEYEPFYVSTV